MQPRGRTVSKQLASWSPDNDRRLREYVARTSAIRNPDGSVSGTAIFELDTLVRVLARLVSVAGVGDPYDREALVRIALSKLAKSRAKDRGETRAFRRFLNSEAARRAQLGSRPFDVIFPLHLESGRLAGFRRLKVLGISLERRPWSSILKKLESLRWWFQAQEHLRQVGVAPILGSRFTPFVASVDAVTPEAAWRRCSGSFDLFRAALNLQSTWGRVSLQAGLPQPLGRVLRAPFVGVVDAAGENTLWYYEAGHYDYSRSNRGADVLAARTLVRRLGRIRGDEIRNLLVEALLNYGQGLDTTDWQQAFLSLWQALELLTLQSKAAINMKVVTNRVCLLLGQRGVDRDLLNSLVDTRNDLVHKGRYPEMGGLDEMQFLKAVVERTFSVLFSWSSTLRRTGDLEALYSKLGASNANLARDRKLAGAVLRRRGRAAKKK
jgi:hypothetical protein